MVSVKSPIRPLVLALAGCVALAAGSLLLPLAPLFDPWAWLVWGRELGALDLDTGAGPSWKPLPVLLGALLAPFGDAAPDLWLLLARSAWLAVPVLAWRLAWRLEGSGGRPAILAGALAAAGVVLVHDAFTSPARQFAGGLSEPLLAALVLGAVEAALARRSRLALGLALAACLLRPEAWPFAALYAWREAGAGRVRRSAVAGGAAVVLLLWFVPDLVAAGNALEGAGRAREGTGSVAFEALEVLGRALAMPLALLWLGAALALAARRDAVSRGLAIGALVWIGLVAVMAAAGYAGLPRFIAPAVAVICAVGAAELVRRLSAGARPRVVVALACLALAADGAWRAAAIPGEVERAADDAASVNDLRAVAAANAGRLLACPPLTTSDFQAQPPLAWELRLPLAGVRTTARYPHSGTLIVGPAASQGLRTVTRLAGKRITPPAVWEAHRTGPCDD